GWGGRLGNAFKQRERDQECKSFGDHWRTVAEITSRAGVSPALGVPPPGFVESGPDSFSPRWERELTLPVPLQKHRSLDASCGCCIANLRISARLGWSRFAAVGMPGVFLPVDRVLLGYSWVTNYQQILRVLLLRLFGEVERAGQHD